MPTSTGVGGAGAAGGAGGVGGVGGAVTTTSTGMMSTTGTGPGASSSSSSGGGDVCAQACDHAAQCGFDVCSQVMIDCSNPQYECIAQCLLPIPCNQLGQATVLACYQKCQGGGTGGGGGGGMGGSGGTGGGSAQACQQCAFQSCGGAVQACAGSNQCSAWFQCVQGCMPGDSQCLFNCDSAHQSAEPLYKAIYSCTCSKCENDCASTFDPCNHVNGGMGGAGGMMP